MGLEDVYLASPYNPTIDQAPIIYDTTLRDGEQTPGVSFRKEDKIRIATLLDEVGIPQLDAGFPAVSKGEKEAVRAVCDEGLEAEILCLSRARTDDIDHVLDIGADGVIVFMATSPIHLRDKLGISFEEARGRALDAVEYAKDHGLFTGLTAEDGTRTDLPTLLDLFRGAEDRKVDRVHIADTVGCILPEGMEKLVEGLVKEIKTPIGVHCHDDFGLALANSLAALRAGVRAVSATVNGIGERAGNCPTEELIMALEVLYGTELGMKTELLSELSQTVEEISGIRRGDAKAIVGKNCFTHESGIHVAAVLKNPLTYEPFLPELVGRKREIVIGKHSGKKAVEHGLESLGMTLDEDGVLRVLLEVKRLADRGNRIDEGELRRIVEKVTKA
jgi:isopropylmalate/homocitrate/citramalate synthase